MVILYTKWNAQLYLNKIRKKVFPLLILASQCLEISPVENYSLFIFYLIVSRCICFCESGWRNVLSASGLVARLSDGLDVKSNSGTRFNMGSGRWRCRWWTHSGRWCGPARRMWWPARAGGPAQASLAAAQWIWCRVQPRLWSQTAALPREWPRPHLHHPLPVPGWWKSCAPVASHPLRRRRGVSHCDWLGSPGGGSAACTAAGVGHPLGSSPVNRLGNKSCPRRKEAVRWLWHPHNCRVTTAT